MVLSNNDGCVIARSAEAKRLGIKIGDPFFKMRDELRRHNVQVFSSNYALYADMSLRVMTTLEEMAPAKQQIVCSRSFGDRITDYEEMRQAVCAYAERAAEKLRQEKQYCRQISVFVRTSLHAVGETFYRNQSTGKLRTPSCDTRDIIRLVMDALDRIWIDGHRYMKAGVMLGDFFSQGVAQLSLFDENQPQANSEALMRVVDGINQSGKAKLWFAGQGIQKSWAMKREMLSPAYTTKIKDIPLAK